MIHNIIIIITVVPNCTTSITLYADWVKKSQSQNKVNLKLGPKGLPFLLVSQYYSDFLTWKLILKILAQLGRGHNTDPDTSHLPDVASCSFHQPGCIAQWVGEGCCWLSTQRTRWRWRWWRTSQRSCRESRRWRRWRWSWRWRWRRWQGNSSLWCLIADFLICLFLQESLEVRKVKVRQAKAVVLRLHPRPLLRHRLLHLEQIHVHNSQQHWRSLHTNESQR